MSPFRTILCLVELKLKCRRFLKQPVCISTCSVVTMFWIKKGLCRNLRCLTTKGTKKGNVGLIHVGSNVWRVGDVNPTRSKRPIVFPRYACMVSGYVPLESANMGQVIGNRPLTVGQETAKRLQPILLQAIRAVMSFVIGSYKNYTDKCGTEVETTGELEMVWNWFWACFYIFVLLSWFEMNLKNVLTIGDDC